LQEAYHTFKRERLAPLRKGHVRDQQLQEISSPGQTAERTAAEKKANQNLAVSLGSLGVAMTGALAFPPAAFLAAPAIIYTMTPVYTKTYQMLKQGKIGVDLLSAITIAGCLSLQYFVVGSTLTVVYCLSNKLLLKVQNDSRKSLIDVFRQQPRSVWVLVDGLEHEIPFETLKIGDIVVVDAGTTIPADGIITEGIASIDQHILTGEAQPAEKSLGDEVFASTVVLSGKIFFEVSQAGEDTIAAKIGNILNSTADFKSATQLRAQTMADRTAVPTLVTSALSIPFVGPYGALAILNAHFKYRMGIVAPISIMNFLNLASQSGILIKDGRTLDLLNQVDTIVFDKTGTLTKEQPYVGNVYTCAGYEAHDVLTFAAAAEHRQTHPIARAIVHEARNQHLTLPHIDEAEYKVGYGLTVMIDQHTVQVGSDRFIEMTGIAIPEVIRHAQTACFEQGHSLVLVAVDQILIGAIELRPTMRPEVKTIIARLRQRPQIKSMYIISGDHETPTQKLAQELGIDHYFAKALPENKADLIEQLQGEGKFICYIGDGINDSIALKKSQVSISLRGASTVATDTAQIVLMDGSLDQVADLFDLAHEFEGNMRAGFLCLCIPTLIGIGGVFFLSFGLLHTMMLTTLGLGSGVMNAMVPMLKRQRAQLVPGPTSHPETVSAPPAAVSAQPSVASSQPSAMSQPVPVVSGSMAHAVPLMAER
jgi:Cu2+-exporting ATPase